MLSWWRSRDVGIKCINGPLKHLKIRDDTKKWKISVRNRPVFFGTPCRPTHHSPPPATAEKIKEFATVFVSATYKNYMPAHVWQQIDQIPGAATWWGHLRNNRQESTVPVKMQFLGALKFYVTGDFSPSHWRFVYAIQVHCVKNSSQGERSFAAEKEQFHLVSKRKRK